MPFVQRVVRPKYLSRVNLHDDDGKPKIKDGELEAVTNFTLSSALRQLASVVLIANEIFEGLSKELEDVTERTTKLRTKINAVEEKVKNFDPRSVTVPEGDLTQFASRSQNYGSRHPITTGLFTPATRPQSVRNLYENAGPTPVAVMRLMDRYRRDGIRCSKFFSVTPVLGANRRKAKVEDIDIETRTPAMVVQLRRWTSIEAMGDVTAELDCTHKVAVPEDDVDHRLPSPEEQLQAVALKFPAEVVPVDVSGRTFNRMSSFRRSLLHVEYEESRRRGGKTRRTRGKRRNTIAGTDSKELAAIVGNSSDTNFGGKSTPDTELSPSAGEKKSHLESLKEWGRSRLRLIRNIEPAVKLRERSASRRKLDKEEPTPHSSSGNWSASSESGQSTATSHHPRSSVSSGSTCQKHSRRPVMVSTSSSVTSESTLTPDDGETCSMYSCDTEGYYTSFHLDSGLKTLREEDPLPPLQSCSALSGSRGNNSTLTADSEYELFGKGSTSTTASSAGTVCTTLLIPPAPIVPERVSSQLTSSNMETSSTQERNITALNNLSSTRKDTSSNKVDKKASNKVDNKQKSNLTKENVSKLKVVDETCSTNMITVEVHHGGEGEDAPEKCGDSPDSGHNTCSSPVDSIASPSIDLEMSECSDLEGVDRMERIRVKTTINSSRIPSMCVITPPQSDDEVSLNALRGPVDIGDYVTIADVRSPPVLKREILIKETEYVSLNELPPTDSSLERKRKGARVTLDSEGKVVYSSDSLRRRKSVHTTGTFEPGPNVATSNTASPVLQHRMSSSIRPVVSSGSPAASGRSSPSATNRIVMPTTTTLRQTNASRSQSPLISNGVQSSQNHTNDSSNSNVKKEYNKSTITDSTNQPAPSLVTNQRNNLSTTRPTATQQYFPRSSFNKLSPKITGRPMSPLAALQQKKQETQSKDFPKQIPPSVFPNLKSLSPKMVVRAKQTARAVSPSSQRGAYVKVSDSPGGPEDDCKYLVKRSDSYRMANDDNKTMNQNLQGRRQYGPAIVAGPSLLSAIQNARNNKDQVDSGKQASLDSGSPGQQPSGSKTRQQASAPPLSSDRINPPRQFGLCSSTPTKSDNSVLDFTTNLSPIRSNRSSTPVPKSRTAMDLYAIIHESKKKINKLKERNNLPVKSEGSSPTHSSPPCSLPTRSSPKPTTEGPNWPKAIPTSYVPNFVNSAMYGQAPVNVSPDRYQVFRKSPSPSDDYRQSSDYRYGSLPYLRSEPTRNSPTQMFASPSRNSSSLDRRKYSLPSPDRPSLASDRHGKVQPTSRNDFKQLLLRTNFGSNSISKSSAVERLKNKVPSPKKSSPSWKSDVLSSTIPEVCSEEDEQTQTTQTIPVSSALVNQQNKAFTRHSPTLETAL